MKQDCLAEQTKQHIIRVADPIFKEKGYQHTTMREIAAAAGISHALLHRYFNKDSLYKACFVSKISQILKDRTDPSKAVHGIDGLKSFLHHQLFPDESTPDYMLRGRELVKMQMDHGTPSDRQYVAELENELKRNISTLIRRGQEEGQIKELDVDALTSLCYLSVFAIIALQTRWPDLVSCKDLEMALSLLRKQDGNTCDSAVVK